VTSAPAPPGWSSTSEPAPRWALAAFSALCALYLLACFHYRSVIGNYVIDDVFIIFRYADNFARGEGLVFNPGEAVEGYTSFTWTLLFGLLAKLGLPLIPAGQFLGMALGLGTLWLTWWTARRLLPGREGLALFAVALVATNRSASIWAVEPLETKLFGFTLALTLALWLRSGPGGRLRGLPVVGLAAATMALTRPEGFMYAGWLVIVGSWPARREGRLGDLGLNAAVFVAIVVAHLGFRLSVYDAWLPNTFAAKVDGLRVETGLDYLTRMIRANWLFLSGVLVIAGVLSRRRAPMPDAYRYFGGLVLLSSITYWIAIGGDRFEFRFFEPLLSLWSVLAALGLAALADGIRPANRRNAIVGIGGLALLGNATSILSPYEGDDFIIPPEGSAEYTRQFVRAARWLATNVPADESLSVRPAGAIPYLTRLHCLDEFGLNDRDIATSDNVQEGAPVGHSRLVTETYIAERGITYYVSHPFFTDRPARAGDGFISAEVEAGVFLMIKRLDPNAELEDRPYFLSESVAPLQGWEPVERP
jgi:hypothetical protein